MTKRILIVEDEEKLVSILADKLLAEGYDVDTALEGERGWELARHESYDLIVLDIMLPGLDGLSLCRMIRNNSTVPIIMLTARGMEADKIVGLESGANDYIVKPFGLGEFLARVRVQMRSQPLELGKMPDELTAGDIRLNLISRRIYIGEVEIMLSNREFDLLSIFMRNRGAVLTRHWLITNVWGEDFLIGENDKEKDKRRERTVDVHIRWLREKIEENPSSPRRISTVRGVGYRFEG